MLQCAGECSIKSYGGKHRLMERKKKYEKERRKEKEGGRKGH